MVLLVLRLKDGCLAGESLLMKSKRWDAPARQAQPEDRVCRGSTTNLQPGGGDADF